MWWALFRQTTTLCLSVAGDVDAVHVKLVYFAIVTRIKSLRHSQNDPFPSIGQHDHFSGILVKRNPLDFPRAPKLAEGVLVGDVFSSILDICDKTPQIVRFVILLFFFLLFFRHRRRKRSDKRVEPALKTVGQFRTEGARVVYGRGKPLFATLVSHV